MKSSKFKKIARIYYPSDVLSVLRFYCDDVEAHSIYRLDPNDVVLFCCRGVGELKVVYRQCLWYDIYKTYC